MIIMDEIIELCGNTREVNLIYNEDIVSSYTFESKLDNPMG